MDSMSQTENNLSWCMKGKTIYLRKSKKSLKKEITLCLLFPFSIEKKIYTPTYLQLGNLCLNVPQAAACRLLMNIYVSPCFAFLKSASKNHWSPCLERKETTQRRRRKKKTVFQIFIVKFQVEISRSCLLLFKIRVP